MARAACAGLLAAWLGVLLAFTPLGPALEERFGLGWLFWMRGPLEPPADVAVVGLGRDTGEHLGLPERLREWPRTLYARLIERLVEAEAALIVFDLRLDQQKNPADDEAFARAIARSGRVVLFEHLDRKVLDFEDEAGGVAARATTVQSYAPVPAFAEAAVGVAPFPLPKVPARISQFWAFRSGGKGEATLPVVALQRHALPVHRDWLRLLEQAGFEGVGQVPRDPAALRDGARLREFMTRLRQAFRDDARLGARLAESLSGSSLAPDDHRVLAALLNAYDGPDSRYLNFYGAAGRVPTIPLYSLIDTRQSAADVSAGLAGRIVFVGQSDLLNTHSDGFVTVFSRDDGVDLSGVEIAATALANLLDDRLLEPAPPWLILVLLAGFGLVIGVLGSVMPAFAGVPVACLVGGAYYAAAQSAFGHDALWLPVVIPLLVQLPVGVFAGLLLQYRAARRARANLARGMHYYLPARVAESFAGGRIDPSALKERVFAVAMVTDASRFTTLAEGMTPEDLSDFLDAYFAILFGVVECYGGIVTDVVGDGMTAVWTAAQPDRPCRLRACRAARDIMREIDAFNERNPRRAMPTRIGLNAGEVIVGNVGGSGRFAYSVVGDCVNTAARLETLNKQLGTRIIAGHNVVEGLDEIATRPLGRFQLFGKTDVLPLSEIISDARDQQDRGLMLEFAVALREFEHGRFANAAQRFQAVLATHPADGPAQFYRKYCERSLASTAVPATQGLVRLEHK